MKNFETNAVMAKIQGLSVQVGELFSDLYASNDSQADHALEAYKSLRRLLPLDGDRHIGAHAAHAATQGAHLGWIPKG
jgi:hypothetical protein